MDDKIENPHLPPEFAERINQLSPEQKRKYLDPDPHGLTILQKAALPIVRWLFYGQIGSGRTVLLAHIFIRRAIETEDAVMVFDHTLAVGLDSYRGKMNVMKVIPEVMKNYPLYEHYITQANHSLRVKKRENPSR